MHQSAPIRFSTYAAAACQGLQRDKPACWLHTGHVHSAMTFGDCSQPNLDFCLICAQVPWHTMQLCSSRTCAPSLI
jgi:hypothetical protein